MSGKLSILRNRNLANVFYRLGFVEIFGTGIIRIKQLYEKALVKPGFEVSENAIKIVLPIFEDNVDLTEDEKIVYQILSETMLKPISEIAPYVPFGKSKTTQLLKNMIKRGLVVVEGKGRVNGVGYRVAKEGNKLVMNLGFSHQVTMEEIDGITIEVPGPNKIIIHGCDKQQVGQFAAEVREKRPPEPYKGKGIKYTDEVIRRKAGKTGAKK